MTDNSRVTIAVVGAAGLIGVRHVAHIIAEPRARLHSVIDITPAGAVLAAEHAVPLYTSIDALLSAQPLPQGVIIATPSKLHIPAAAVLVKRGIDVLVEKPLCNSVEEATELEDACRQPGAGSVLVGFHRRCNPYVVHAKHVLDNDKANLGRIVAIQAAWCTRKPSFYFTQVPWRMSAEAGGGVILTNLSHELDTLCHLFGPVQRVYAEAADSIRGYDVEDTVAITLKFKQGPVASLLLSDSTLAPYSFESATGENPHLARHHQPVYTIMGTTGTIQFPTFQRWYSFEEEGNWTNQLTSDFDLGLGFDSALATDVGPNAPFTVRLQHWIDVITKKATPNCTLEDGLRNVRLLQAVLRSARTGNSVSVE